MKKIKKQSLIRLLVLFAAFLTVFFLVKTPQNLSLKKTAASSTTFSNISIVNITDRSFTVIWTTSEPATGTVMYVEKGNTKSSIAYDVRDKKTKSLKTHTVHYVQVSGLKPQTVYSFTIQSNGSNFSDGPKPFAAATGRRIKKLNPSHPIVLPIPDFSKKGDEVIIILTARSDNKQSNAMAALVSDKYAIFDGGNFRQNNLAGMFQIKNETDLTITVITTQNVWSYSTVISPETNLLASLFLHSISE